MPGPGVEDLKRTRPEWAPWLSLVHETLAESSNQAWDTVVPERRAQQPGTPALSGASVTIPPKLARGLLDRLAAAAARSGTPKMSDAAGTIRHAPDPAALFQASITQDTRRVDEIAAAGGADPAALQAIVSLVALPFLHACNRRWSSANGAPWTEGYCHICGSWPAFAEMRGVERSRFLRCGRCGGEWYARILHCTYCRTTTHEEMVALVPESDASRALEACKRCGGYLKVFTRLQGCAPSAVLLGDLASVNLDVAAVEAGYRRPAGAGCPPAISASISAGRRFLSWSS